MPKAAPLAAVLKDDVSKFGSAASTFERFVNASDYLGITTPLPFSVASKPLSGASDLKHLESSMTVTMYFPNVCTTRSVVLSRRVTSPDGFSGVAAVSGKLAATCEAQKCKVSIWGMSL